MIYKEDHYSSKKIMSILLNGEYYSEAFPFGGGVVPFY